MKLIINGTQLESNIFWALAAFDSTLIAIGVMFMVIHFFG